MKININGKSTSIKIKIEPLDDGSLHNVGGRSIPF